MKLQVNETSYTVKPKQTEGKLVVRFDEFSVQPKPRGVKLFKKKSTSVLKTDERTGVRIEKRKTNKIVKQWD